MNRSQMCVANVKYKQPSANGERQTWNLLKYLTYRDSRDDYVPQKNGRERWVDHGLRRKRCRNCRKLRRPAK